MPLLTKNNCRTFHRKLYGGMGALETVTLLKRGDNQQQGTVTQYTLHDIRHSPITKTGETITGDTVSDHHITWHIPRVELDRIGVYYLNPLDRIKDSQGRYWQPESDTLITVKLMETHLCLECVRRSA